jgi:hypothetical protein
MDMTFRNIRKTSLNVWYSLYVGDTPEDTIPLSRLQGG